MNKILIVVNIPKFFVSHWLRNALKAKEAGYEIHIASSDGNEVTQIEASGLIHHKLPLERSGQNPFKEIQTFLSLLKIVKKIKPDLLHLITIKPVIYGCLVAYLTKTKAILCAITGLGYVFINSHKNTFLKSVVKNLYATALRHKNLTAVFENETDRDTFVGEDIIAKDKTIIIHGAGVDLSEFDFLPEPDGQIKVVFAARLLKDKGVFEFVAAAQQISATHEVQFIIVGDIDPDNPASLTQRDIANISGNKHISFLGFRSDIASIFADCHIVVLPSYREGLPKVLIEAAACGRAVVTTDVPGCKHVILANETGLLVTVKDSKKLAGAIIQLIDNTELRQRFGAAGRQLAEQKYCESIISATYINCYRNLLASHL